MITARKAILMASDLIGTYPARFNFHNVGIPGSHEGAACALGWIGFFYGIPRHWMPTLSTVAINVLGIPPELDDRQRPTEVFYERMTELVRAGKWMWDAHVCARALRAYADRYHPESVTPSQVWNEVA